MAQKKTANRSTNTTSINKKQLNIPAPSAKTDEQKELFKSFNKNILTLATGPAGCGKTYCAVSQALYEFSKNKYSKLIFTRPAVEAYGERLGFLPGGAEDKLAPYMLPIMDTLEGYLDENFISELIKKKQIQTIPLAFQRGLNFKDSFVVFDEAQNATADQMRMFLTRIGENCKVVVTGDLRQTDRLGGINGLRDATNRLIGVNNVGIVKLTEKSIVRSQLVADIEAKYNSDDDLE